MLGPNIETFIGCEADFESCDIVMFGAPYDSTTSFRPGARFASAAIRHESFGIETYSPYQDKDLLDYKIFDSGDIELPFGNQQESLNLLKERAKIILDAGKLPFMIGGEHLVSYAPISEVFKKYPDLHIIQFDAHADLRDDYLGNKLSHACVMRRSYELVSDAHIHQFCIRSGEREEFMFAKEHTDMHKFNFDGLNELCDKLIKDNTPVYLTIDLDCLDSGIFPGTGTPEAGGVSFNELLNAMIKVGKCNVVGADVNELAPNLDTSGMSTAVACKVVRELLLALAK